MTRHLLCRIAAAARSAKTLLGGGLDVKGAKVEADLPIFGYALVELANWAPAEPV